MKPQHLPEWKSCHHLVPSLGLPLSLEGGEDKGRGEKGRWPGCSALLASGCPAPFCSPAPWLAWALGSRAVEGQVLTAHGGVGAAAQPHPFHRGLGLLFLGVRMPSVPSLRSSLLLEELLPAGHPEGQSAGQDGGLSSC